MREPEFKYRDRWHATLNVQVPWTYELDGIDAAIFCPGNVARWRVAQIETGDPEQCMAYAALMASAPKLYDALLMVLPLAEEYLKSAPSHPDNAKLETARAALSSAQGDGK